MNTHGEQKPARATVGDLLRGLALLLFAGGILFGLVVQFLDELHVAPIATVTIGIGAVVAAYCWLVNQ